MGNYWPIEIHWTETYKTYRKQSFCGPVMRQSFCLYVQGAHTEREDYFYLFGKLAQSKVLHKTNESLKTE